MRRNTENANSFFVRRSVSLLRMESRIFHKCIFLRLSSYRVPHAVTMRAYLAKTPTSTRAGSTPRPGLRRKVEVPPYLFFEPSNTVAGSVRHHVEHDRNLEVVRLNEYIRERFPILRRKTGRSHFSTCAPIAQPPRMLRLKISVHQYGKPPHERIPPKNPTLNITSDQTRSLTLLGTFFSFVIFFTLIFAIGANEALSHRREARLHRVPIHHFIRWNIVFANYAFHTQKKGRSLYNCSRARDCLKPLSKNHKF